jgi:hypothetical protein
MGYTLAQANAFINQIAPLMQKEGKARGYKIISTAVAQAVIESAAGTSSLGYKYHNYFGLKCGSSWKGASVNLKTKEEYTVGKLTTIKDNFRVYPNMEEGVKGYYDFISTKRYSNLKTATTPKQYAEYLKSDGYATSSSYISTLVSTVSKYNLTRYDSTEIPEILPDPVIPKLRTLKKGSKGDDVKALQTFLNINGYNCGLTDGVFGAKTEVAVKAFQKAHPACGTPDGIVGRKTWTVIQDMLN